MSHNHDFLHSGISGAPVAALAVPKSGRDDGAFLHRDDENAYFAQKGQETSSRGAEEK